MLRWELLGIDSLQIYTLPLFIINLLNFFISWLYNQKGGWEKYGNFTYTFLGKNKSHLNITGIKSILEVETAINSLTIFSNLELCNFKNFTIDNISTTFKTYPGLKEILLNIKDGNFRIFKPCRFCGIIIKVYSLE